MGSSEWAGVPRQDALLSMQRALWQIPTPELRGVVIGERAGAVAADFLYDGEICDNQRELVALAESCFFADCPPETVVQFRAVATRAPEPLDMRGLEDWVYLRWEPEAE
jgi:hypothetical protein